MKSAIKLWILFIVFNQGYVFGEDFADEIGIPSFNQSHVKGGKELDKVGLRQFNPVAYYCRVDMYIALGLNVFFMGTNLVCNYITKKKFFTNDNFLLIQNLVVTSAFNYGLSRFLPYGFELVVPEKIVKCMTKQSISHDSKMPFFIGCAAVSVTTVSRLNYLLQHSKALIDLLKKSYQS